jgi:hypothetical protein
MNYHDGIEPYKFSLSLRDDVIEIVLLYRRQDGCTYCVTELVGLTSSAVKPYAFAKSRSALVRGSAQLNPSLMRASVAHFLIL